MFKTMCTSFQSGTFLHFAPRLQEACAFDAFTNTSFTWLTLGFIIEGQLEMKYILGLVHLCILKMLYFFEGFDACYLF